MAISNLHTASSPAPSALPMPSTTTHAPHAQAAASIDTQILIDTPEQIRFAHRVAGPAQRMLAYTIDAFIRGVVLVVLVIIGTIAGVVTAGSAYDKLASGTSVGLILVAVFVLEWGYFTLFEAMWRGRTPGKRLLGLRVISEDGRAIDIGQSMLRNLLRAADVLPNVTYALGIVVLALDPKFRRIGDMVAGTVVVAERTSNLLEPLDARQLTALAGQIDLAHVDRRATALSREERDAVESLLRRRDSLPPARTRELAAILAPSLARRAGIPCDDPLAVLAAIYLRSR